MQYKSRFVLGIFWLLLSLSVSFAGTRMVVCEETYKSG